MIRRLVLILGLQVLAAQGCATQDTWSPTVDTFGNSRAQYAYVLGSEFVE